VCNFDNAQSISIYEISEHTLIKIKKWLLTSIKNYNLETYEKIGVENCGVQLDETVICTGCIITQPSNTLDNVNGIQWILGGIEKNEARKFFMLLVPNRKR
jgi:hypothetical protein